MGLFPDETSSPRHFHTMKWVGLAVGCLAKFVTGSLFVFNVYENAIKTTFNYTETEVQLQSSLLNIGLGFGFIPGKFYDHFGPQWASLGGVIVSVLAYTLLWSTTKYVSFYQNKSWLMAIYFFLSGLGSVFTYMVALNTNVINFDEKHRGKIVGLLNAFFAGSPSVFAAIYYHVIGDPASTESFTTMMLMFAISFGITDIICMIFLRIYTKPNELMEQRELQTNISMEESSSTCCDEVTKTRKIEGTPLRDLLRNVDFYIFTLMFTFASTVGLVYVIALTQTTDAMNFSSHDPDVVLIVPITNALISVCIGTFSDYFRDRLPRLTILIAGCISFVVCQVLVVSLADGYTWIVIATIFCGIGVGLVWSISPTIMSEFFDVADLGRNWGIALFLGSLMGLGAQESFGAFYDAAKKNPSDIYCNGIECVRRGHAVALASGIVAVILGTVLLWKRRNSNQHRFESFD
ncbi:uncharacterized MFS-type transporter YhjX-like [Ylistrum balloti]|uniref:uncharacterized MFS-type transporter YhjX-like n=1 Tax=Ylistrum balloti TaxID=509963 RepID=UPI002905DFE5|nr:uncharacterized MFS-type transporter YhjX-like [Ylistrum balloti]